MLSFESEVLNFLQIPWQKSTYQYLSLDRPVKFI